MGPVKAVCEDVPDTRCGSLPAHPRGDGHRGSPSGMSGCAQSESARQPFVDGAYTAVVDQRSARLSRSTFAQSIGVNSEGE